MNQHAIGYGQTPRATYSIPQFCEAHGISRTHCYELINLGRGPRLMKVSRRTLVSVEAAADWRKMMEKATSAEADSAALDAALANPIMTCGRGV